MYKVCIYNSGQETIIHYPTADKTAPHLLNSDFKETLSQAELFSFSIPYGNPGYNLIEGLKTKVKVFDTRDDSVIFSGRVLNTKDGMSKDGKFTNEVTCEGAMNYLIDSQTRRWHFQDQTPTQILSYLLDQHNAKVDDSRKIYIGTVEVTQHITIDTNYETTLNAIITKLHNILGGDFRVRETNGILYLDYLLAQGANNGVEIRLRYNLKEIIREYDPTDIITRAIPLGYGEGVNQLNIKKVNNGVEYIEDADAIAEYGIIEGVVTNKDIQNANTLKIYGQTVLNEKKQPKLSYNQSALDLSVLTGHENEKYDLGDTIHTLVDVKNIDVYARVIERERDLICSPWDPKLTISTRPITLTDQIIDLKQRSQTLENAPQGSTYIDTFGYAENIDATHSFKLPIWLSPDILNVNRVRLHIDSQKFRAYEKSITGGASSTATSGPSSKTTSDDGGDHKHKLFEYQSQGLIIDTEKQFTGADSTGGLGHNFTFKTDMAADIYTATSSGAHSHGMDHTHGMNHTHTNTLNYGIFENTYPADVTIKINGMVIPNVSLSEGGSLDLDISEYVGAPGETYNIEVTSSQNGRVNVWVSIQAFIQSK